VFFVSALLPATMLQSVSAGTPTTALFISSDPGDDLFASMFAERAPGVAVLRCALGSNLSASGSVVYVLDYNLNSDGSGWCSSWPPEFGYMLLDMARRGSTVVLGYNTLRLISVFEPGVLSSLGFVFVDDSRPVALYVEASDVLRGVGAPEKVLYDVGVYRRAEAAPISGWRVLARFSDGAPAIVEARVGGGRIILLLFNPVWPAVNGEEAYVDLVAALHRYVTSGPGSNAQPMYIAAAAAAIAAAVVASASSASPQRGDEILRRIDKPVAVVVVLGYKLARVDPLKHPVREQIYRLAEEKPYVTVEDVMALGVNRTPALWHLEILVSAGLLASEKVLGKTIYFKPEKRREAVVALVLESEHRRKILLELLEETRTLTWLAKALGISKSTVKHHLDAMIQIGVVETNGVGYTVSEWAKQIIRQMLAEAKT